MSAYIRSNSLKTAWFVWLLASLFYAYDFMQRLSPSTMIPELMADFTVTASALGTLSAFFYYSYGLAQIPAGIIIDRFNLRWVLGGAALLVGIGSLMQTFAESLWAANAARAFIGIGSAFSFISCVKIGTTWFFPNRLPLIIGLTNFFGVLGALLGGAPLTYLVETYTWRTTFWYASYIALGLSLLIFLFVRTGPLVQSSRKMPPVSEQLCDSLYCRQTWLLALYAALMVAPLAAFGELWSIPFLEAHYGLSRSEATFANSLIFVGIAIGSPLIGFLVSSRRFAPKPLMFASVLGAAFCFWFMLNNHITQLLFLLLPLYGFFTSNMLLCFSLVSHIHPKNKTGMAIGFTNMLITAGGALLQPGIGYLIDYLLPSVPGAMTFSDEALRIALLPLLACFAFALLLLTQIKIPDAFLQE